MTEKPAFPPNIALLIGIIAVSTASIFIRMSSAPPLVIASYRLIFATIILLPFYIRSGEARRFIKTSRQDLITILAVGTVLALHFASWITSLSLTSVTSSVLFVHIDPIFVAIISHFFLKEKVERNTLIGIIVAIIGATVIAMGDAGIGKTNLVGDLLSLVGALMLGLYILAGRKLRQRLSLISYVTPVYSTSAIVLVLLTVLSRTKLGPYPLNEYLLFIVIGVVPMIFGHTVYNWTLKYIEAPIVSISLLGEPIGATILAYIFLAEIPSKISLIGGMITLLGIFLCISSTS